MAIVTQDPILFGTSIKENIQYGNNEREVGMIEVIDAAKKANIHQFITSLPEVKLVVVHTASSKSLITLLKLLF